MRNQTIFSQNNNLAIKGCFQKCCPNGPGQVDKPGRSCHCDCSQNACFTYMKHHFSFWATPFGQTVAKAFGQHFGQHFWATPPFILGNTFGQHTQEIWATLFGNTPPLFGQHPLFHGALPYCIHTPSREGPTSEVSSQMPHPRCILRCLLPNAFYQLPPPRRLLPNDKKHCFGFHAGVIFPNRLHF